MWPHEDSTFKIQKLYCPFKNILKWNFFFSHTYNDSNKNIGESYLQLSIHNKMIVTIVITKIGKV